VGGEDDAQARGVDEPELAQVQHDHRRSADLGAVDLTLEERSACQVEFADETKYDHVVVLAHVDPQMLVGYHSAMLADRIFRAPAPSAPAALLRGGRRGRRRSIQEA